VLAAADERLVREARLDLVDDLADERPGERPHIGEAKGVGVGVEPFDDLLGRQAERVELLLGALRDLIGCLGHGVEHRDLVASLAQRGGDVGETERETRPQRRHRVHVQVERRVDQLDLHGGSGLLWERQTERDVAGVQRIQRPARAERGMAAQECGHGRSRPIAWAREAYLSPDLRAEDRRPRLAARPAEPVNPTAALAKMPA
jgi:hypothetical protein